MSTMLVDDQSIRIPVWVNDRLSFRRWLQSERFPSVGRIGYLAGEVWVDTSKEQLFSHNQVKQEFFRALGQLVKSQRLGRFFPDGVYLSNADGDFLSRPDGLFASSATLKSQRIRFVEGGRAGFVELEGTPDMVLEFVSDSSVTKDTDLLREAYWLAGIPEYWLVDVRRSKCSFELLRHGAKGYVSTRKQNDWLRSAVFDASFRLACGRDELGNPSFDLSSRAA